jgi:thiamine-phosphate pyrophosphorylase
MTQPQSLGPQALRLVDANLNRLAEGLRYLEDVARFLLNDSGLTTRLKSLRHALVAHDLQFQKQLLDSRDSSGDVGVGLEVPQNERPQDLPSSVVANSRRVQEALRTLEEFSKVVTLPMHLSLAKLESARFEVYDIEKDLLGRLLRQDAAKRIRGLYVIIDSDALKGRKHADVTRQTIRGGASIIQLRDKTMDRGKLLPIAREMKQACAEAGVLFFINDYLDLALAVEADGLHVGQTDLPVATVRKLVSLDMLVGCSVYNAEQAMKAEADGADYVAVGALFPTPSKESVVVGLGALRAVKQAVSAPVVAIGGIGLENAAEVKAAGADSICVISAVLGATSPEDAARRLLKRFEGEDGKTD